MRWSFILDVYLTFMDRVVEGRALLMSVRFSTLESLQGRAFTAFWCLRIFFFLNVLLNSREVGVWLENNCL